MVFQSLTYTQNQYPPLSSTKSSTTTKEDIKSYTKLHKALIRNTELKKEGYDKVIVNEEELAKLVSGIVNFQDLHLGRKSTSKYWPTTRIPSQIFTDRTTNGPLSIAIIAAFRVKNYATWRNFNFDNPKLFDDNISIIKQIQNDLITAGHLQPKVFYFDTSITEGIGSNEIHRLSQIAIKYGATITNDVNDIKNNKVTHIIAYDPEEHDTQLVIDDEIRRTNNNDEAPEKAYLKTLTIKQVTVNELKEANVPIPPLKLPPLKTNTASIKSKKGPCGSCENCLRDDCGTCRQCLDKRKFGGENKLKQKCAMRSCLNPGGQNAKQLAEDEAKALEKAKAAVEDPGVRQMALVHWWYHPSSYDEWTSADEVSNILEVDEHPGIVNGPAVVGCKFVRDVEKFNEWGVESDYAVMEYRRKIAYFREEIAAEKAAEEAKKQAAEEAKRLKKLEAEEAKRAELASRSPKKLSKSEYDKKRREAMKAGTWKPPSKQPKAPKPEPPPQYQLPSNPSTNSLPSAVEEIVGLGGVVEPMPKKSKREEFAAIGPALSMASIASTSSTTAYPRRKSASPSKPSLDPASKTIIPSRESSERRTNGTGMNPRRINTGIRGLRNEHIKRVVYDGALRVEEEPYKIVKEALADYSLGGAMDQPSLLLDEKEGGSAILLNARPEWRKLLPPTGFIRPSVDTSLKCMTVTELTVQDNAPPSDEMEVTILPSTVTSYHSVPILVHPEDEDNSGGEEAISMRGGGEEEEGKKESVDVDAPPQEQEKVVAGDSNVSTNPEASGEVVAVQHAEGNTEAPVENVPASDVAVEGNVQAEVKEDAMQVDATEKKVNEEAKEEPAPEQPKEGSDEPPKADAMEVDHVESEPTSETKTSEDQTTAPQPQASTTTLTDTQVSLVSNALSAAAAAPPSSSSNGQVISTTTTQEAVPSSATAAPAPAPLPTQTGLAKVVSLPEGTQISASLYQSSSTAAEEVTIVKPSWYEDTKPSELEQRSLPEWFNSSAPHRTADTYIAAREKILELAKKNGQQFITSTAIRRSVPGDAGSLLRLHKFMMDWGLLNGGQVGETAPSDPVLRGIAGTKRKSPPKDPFVWTTERVKALEVAVFKNAKKRPADGSDPSSKATIVVKWDAVAAQMGDGITPSDCQRAFISPPSDSAKMVADASSNGDSKASLSAIVDGVDPKVLKAAIEGSLQCTDDVSEARKASLVAAVASSASQKAAEAESEIERTLMDIVDQRLQRLENRVALLDDVEALMEAERVSLELERRDMYTTRCRHWFGDGS